MTLNFSQIVTLVVTPYRSSRDPIDFDTNINGKCIQEDNNC